MNQSDGKETSYSDWLWLAQCLPTEGVAVRFPDDVARVERLVKVRWPDGVECSRCKCRHASWIKTRALFQCEVCRFQFSVTSGTALHRTRLSLAIWFSATESIIRYRTISFIGEEMPAHALAQKFDIQYVSARRMRKIIIAEILLGEQGILLPAICGPD